MTKRFLAAAAAILMIAMVPAASSAVAGFRPGAPRTSQQNIAPAAKLAAASDDASLVLAGSGHHSHSHGKKKSDVSAETEAESGTASLKTDSAAEAGLPGNLRLSCGEWSASAAEKVGEEAAQVSRQGLETLRVSGSAQPSLAGLSLLRDDLLGKIPAGSEIWIADLRQESHFYADGVSMSIADSSNEANTGLSTAEVTLLEQEQMQALAAGELAGKSLCTEQQAAEALGMHYVRFAITDHYFPEPAVVDEIIQFYRSLPENAWVHFHCRAGRGRTTSLCMMFDILRNPELDYETLALRQYLLGGKDLRESSSSGKKDSSSGKKDSSSGSSSGKKSSSSGHSGGKKSSSSGSTKLKQEKMLPLFYQYVNAQRSNDFQLSWSDWLQLAEN